MKISSYVAGQWHQGDGGVEVHNAVTGESVGRVSSQGIDFSEVVQYGRQTGGSALRKMTMHDRALALKALALYLLERKERYYDISAWTGATRADPPVWRPY